MTTQAFPKPVRLTIKGRPASKKNSRRNFGHVSLPSLAYEAFRESALWQLKSCKTRYTGPVVVTYYFKQKGRLNQDVDNAMASINDVLQESGIIADDKLITKGSFEKEGGYDDFETELKIEEMVK